MDEKLVATIKTQMVPESTDVLLERWTENDIDPGVESRLADVLASLHGLCPNTDDEGQPCPVVVPLAPDGRMEWIKFHDAHAEEQDELTGDLAAVWSKLEAYTARLALIIHFVRWAAGDPTLTDPDAIDAQSVGMGARLCQWFGHEARRVYAVLGESDEDREQRQYKSKEPTLAPSTQALVPGLFVCHFSAERAGLPVKCPLSLCL